MSKKLEFMCLDNKQQLTIPDDTCKSMCRMCEACVSLVVIFISRNNNLAISDYINNLQNPSDPHVLRDAPADEQEERADGHCGGG